MKVWLSTEIEPFYIGGSMNGSTSVGPFMVWPNDVVAGARRRTRLARLGYSLSIAGTANRQGRSSAPDDDVPQIASAFGLLDPRLIILQSLQIDLARSLPRLPDENPDRQPVRTSLYKHAANGLP